MYISLLGFAPAGWLPRKITNLVRFSVFTYKKYKVYFTNNISAVTRVMLPVDFHIYLKLQSVSFASLSPSLFEILELQLFEELSSLRGVCSGTAPAQMNLIFLKSMCGSQSPHRCGYLV